jgi:hypothetical protein
MAVVVAAAAAADPERTMKHSNWLRRPAIEIERKELFPLLVIIATSFFISKATR